MIIDMTKSWKAKQPKKEEEVPKPKKPTKKTPKKEAE